MVSVMPCTAKKHEAARPEMSRDGRPDVDFVITTRELGRLLLSKDIRLKARDRSCARRPSVSRLQSFLCDASQRPCISERAGAARPNCLRF